jgi:hypothetical protein
MIDFTLTYLKPVALFISAMILFQCCKVYEKRPVTIEQAINKDDKKQKRIKIEMVVGKKIIANSIYYKGDNLYYSKNVKSREKIENADFYRTKKFIAEVKIDEENIWQVYPYNRKKSRTCTAFLVITPVLLIGAGLFGLMLCGIASDCP